jgi:hypothetical protein
VRDKVSHPYKTTVGSGNCFANSAPFTAQWKYSDLCVGSESGASVTLPSVGKRLYAKQEWPLRDEQSGAAQRCLICCRKSARDRNVFSFWIYKIGILFIIQSHFYRNRWTGHPFSWITARTRLLHWPMADRMLSCDAREYT